MITATVKERIEIYPISTYPRQSEIEKIRIIEKYPIFTLYHNICIIHQNLG